MKIKKNESYWNRFSRKKRERERKKWNTLQHRNGGTEKSRYSPDNGVAWTIDASRIILLVVADGEEFVRLGMPQAKFRTYFRILLSHTLVLFRVFLFRLSSALCTVSSCIQSQIGWKWTFSQPILDVIFRAFHIVSFNFYFFVLNLYTSCTLNNGFDSKVTQEWRFCRHEMIRKKICYFW